MSTWWRGVANCPADSLSSDTHTRTHARQHTCTYARTQYTDRYLEISHNQRKVKLCVRCTINNNTVHEQQNNRLTDDCIHENKSLKHTLVYTEESKVNCEERHIQSLSLPLMEKLIDTQTDRQTHRQTDQSQAAS